MNRDELTEATERYYSRLPPLPTPVIIGAATLVLSPATMHRIVQDWLHTHLSGGPYSVTDVQQGSMDDAFSVTFTATPTTDTEGGSTCT